MLLHSQPLHSPTYVYGFNLQKHIQGLHLSNLLSLHPGSILYSTHPLQSDRVFFLSFLLPTQHSRILLLLFLELFLSWIMSSVYYS